MKKYALLLTCLVSASACFADPIVVNLLTVAHDYANHPGNQTYTKAEHDIEIINNSNRSYTFSYTYYYCAQDKPCVNLGNSITVGAHKKWNNHHDSFLTPIYDQNGTYALDAKTSVYGPINREYHAHGNIMIRE